MVMTVRHPQRCTPPLLTHSPRPPNVARAGQLVPRWCPHRCVQLHLPSPPYPPPSHAMLVLCGMVILSELRPPHLHYPSLLGHRQHPTPQRGVAPVLRPPLLALRWVLGCDGWRPTVQACPPRPCLPVVVGVRPLLSPGCPPAREGEAPSGTRLPSPRKRHRAASLRLPHVDLGARAPLW